MKTILLILMLWSSSVFSQTFDKVEDTIPIIIYYSDTVLQFDETEVASIYNSKCLKEMKGYIVLWMYGYIFIDDKKQPLLPSIKIWFYKRRK